MIVVDVKVPALDAVYDFSVSEDAPVELLIEELAELICQKERLEGAQNEAAFVLYSVAKGQALARGHTLAEYGIATGDQLILV